MPGARRQTPVCPHMRQSTPAPWAAIEYGAAGNSDTHFAQLQSESVRKSEARLQAHNVYVIELDRAVLRDRRFRARNPNYVEGMPCVYVGMTGLSVPERLANHRDGYKSNRYAHRYGVRLLPALYEVFNPMPYEVARQMEQELADELQEKGYAVWQG